MSWILRFEWKLRVRPQGDLCEAAGHLGSEEGKLAVCLDTAFPRRE
jgi:hypothetical protein